MTQYVSVIKGGAEEDSRGERREANARARIQSRFVLFVRTPVLLKKRESGSLFSSRSREVTRHCFSSPVMFSGCHRKDGPLEMPLERPLDELVITLL